MAISGISGSSNNYYGMIASGKRINSAADDAAGLAIAEKLESQANGYDVGRDNAAAGQDMLRVAEGGLGSIMDSLQRMRELSVQASNTAIYGKDELGAMQNEIDQLKQSIQDAAKYTQFNTMNLLDGSKESWNIATNPDGSGSKVTTPNSTLAALGIENYDVSGGNFDMKVLDDAISKVSDAMSSIGASYNGLEHRMNFNSYASYNLTASKSRIEDLDIPKAVSEKEKERLLNEYKMHFLRRQIEDQNQKAGLLRF